MQAVCAWAIFIMVSFSYDADLSSEQGHYVDVTICNNQSCKCNYNEAVEASVAPIKNDGTYIGLNDTKARSFPNESSSK